MIQAIDTEKGNAPIIVCDHCGERITDARSAGVVTPDSDRYPNGNRRILHLHNGKCLEAVAISENEKRTCVELPRHLRLLIENVDLSLEGLIQRKKIDKEQGRTNR